MASSPSARQEPIQGNWTWPRIVPITAARKIPSTNPPTNSPPEEPSELAPRPKNSKSHSHSKRMHGREVSSGAKSTDTDKVSLKRDRSASCHCCSAGDKPGKETASKSKVAESPFMAQDKHQRERRQLAASHSADQEPLSSSSSARQVRFDVPEGQNSLGDAGKKGK